MIGVIADDLSGAAEIAAVGLRHGLCAEVLVGGKPSGKAELVCVDTDSRGCTAREAARRAITAAKLLRQAGAQWIYKKVDSVLRGNVAAEIGAIRNELRLKQVLLHPANPARGRTIKDGKYFVRGRLLHQTEFARDPAYPRRTADVRLLLGKTKLPVQVCAPAEPLADFGIILCESASPRDVQSWANRVRPEILPAGGAEFFSALLERRSPNRLLSSRGPSRSDSEIGAPARELFICGTTSKSAQQFVRAARQAGTPVFSLPRELAGGAAFTRTAMKTLSAQVLKAFQTKPRVILQTGLPPVKKIAIAQKLAAHLTRLAETVLNQAAIQRVYVEGGATAMELVRRMGWTRLAVLREVAPGVATLAVNGHRSLQLTIKPGTYVWPDEITARPSRKT